MFHPKRAFQSDPGFRKDIKGPEVSSRCHEITLALLQTPSGASRWLHAWEKKKKRKKYLPWGQHSSDHFGPAALGGRVLAPVTLSHWERSQHHHLGCCCYHAQSLQMPCISRYESVYPHQWPPACPVGGGSWEACAHCSNTFHTRQLGSNSYCCSSLGGDKPSSGTAVKEQEREGTLWRCRRHKQGKQSSRGL